MTIAVGAVTAFYFVEDRPVEILYVASAAVMGFGLLERRWRLDWNVYVQRYKFLRRLLHEDVELRAISPLDLTNKYRHDERQAAFAERYGPFLGPQLAKANAGPDHSFPQSTAREMLLFYGIILGALLYLAGLLRPTGV